jgi:hypothetical protein
MKNSPFCDNSSVSRYGISFNVNFDHIRDLRDVNTFFYRYFKVRKLICSNVTIGRMKMWRKMPIIQLYSSILPSIIWTVLANWSHSMLALSPKKFNPSLSLSSGLMTCLYTVWKQQNREKLHISSSIHMEIHLIHKNWCTNWEDAYMWTSKKTSMNTMARHQKWKKYIAKFKLRIEPSLIDIGRCQIWPKASQKEEKSQEKYLNLCETVKCEWFLLKFMLFIYDVKKGR